MSKPFPILAVPTPDDRERFLKIAYSGGLTWGSRLTQSSIDSARNNTRYTHVYLWMDNTFQFTEDQDEVKNTLNTHALVNSPRHFVQYYQTLKS